MSDTNVKVKATSAQSDAKPSAAKNAESAKAAPGTKSELPPLDDIAEKARPYLDEHGHAIRYGIIGIVAAVLILTIGFWPVFLLAAFAAIGIAIGKLRDSGTSMQTAARSLVGNFHK